jgi:tripartite-type tricarboxylate transporter receptor subunit TctC
MGRPFVAPPEIPADRRDALRAAFDQTMKDPGFLADAEKSKIDPVGGAAIDALVKDLYRTPPDVVAQARKAVENAR